MDRTTARPRWDGPVTVVLGLLLAAAAAYGFLAGVLTVFIGDACADVRCDYIRLSTGVLIAVAGQPAVLLAATVAAFVLQARGRRTFVAPLVGLALVAAVLFGGLAIAYSAVPGASMF